MQIVNRFLLTLIVVDATGTCLLIGTHRKDIPQPNERLINWDVEILYNLTCLQICSRVASSGISCDSNSADV